MVSTLFILFLLTVLRKGIEVDGLKLKQVLIFSRHNVRTPLADDLYKYTYKPWPKLDAPFGHLTARGALLERYMGDYFLEWFKKEQFLPEGCPKEDIVYAFTSSKSRTRATARAFLDSVFRNCDVNVHHTEAPDPLFSPAIRNRTEAFKKRVFEEIHRKLYNNLKLRVAYAKLNTILEIHNSDICRKDSICDLTQADNTIWYKVGEELWGKGPLFIANSAVDAFTMNYYDGRPLPDVAWGRISTPKKWEIITEVSRQDQYIRYETVASDIGAPLMNYLTTIFKNYDKMPKLMLIVGHDYNMNSIAMIMGFKSVVLPHQYEKYPIGGKFVFQRWTDGENDYLKVEHVYGSWSQLRNATKLSLETPPERVLMELDWCKTNIHGFCPWNEFVNKLSIIY